MKTLLTLIAVGVFALLASHVLGQEQQRPLPLGVSAENWIPVSDQVGFVITQGVPNQQADVLSGYFLAWHEDSWKRIDSAGGARFQPVRK
jgi:hypothetical protein